MAVVRAAVTAGRPEVLEVAAGAEAAGQNAPLEVGHRRARAGAPSVHGQQQIGVHVDRAF